MTVQSGCHLGYGCIRCGCAPGAPDHREHHLDRADDGNRWPSAEQLARPAVGSAVADVRAQVASTPRVSMQRASHGVDSPLRAAHSMDSDAPATVPSTLTGEK